MDIKKKLGALQCIWKLPYCILKYKYVFQWYIDDIAKKTSMCFQYAINVIECIYSVFQCLSKEVNVF
jgi:hypothetical protein